MQQRALGIEGRGDGIRGTGKDGEQAITLAAALDDRAAVHGDDGGQQGIMAGQGGAHRLRLLLPALGAGLDVSEEKGDSAAGKVRHAPSIRFHPRSCWFWRFVSQNCGTSPANSSAATAGMSNPNNDRSLVLGAAEPLPSD